MENMLRRFAILCGGDYHQAILLNHLFYEAHKHFMRSGSYTITFNLTELSEELGIPEFELDYDGVALSDGAELIDYRSAYGPDKDLIEVTCTPNIQAIDSRLSQIAVEEEKIKRHNKRAIALNNPGTLTVTQWMALLNHFQWGCAYCTDGPYDVLEHIIPLTFPSSGTTRWNCVPACNKCNSLKGPYHPDRMPRSIRNSIGKRLESVRNSLDEWKKSHDEWKKRLKRR